MKILLALTLTCTLIFAQNVQITADNFSADEVKGTGEFSGHVKVTKQDDILQSDTLTINFDKNKKPLKYQAQGNANIEVTIKGKKYFGKGEILIYEPTKEQYTIKQNAFLEDKTTNKKIYGDEIVVNQLNGKYDVKSKNNKPVKFIFQIEDKK